MIEEKMQLWVIASLTLGLAPFAPEPHIWGKLKWISGGAVGMQAMDWFDVVLHGTPWLLLTIALLMKVKGMVTK
ncbi:MAG: hypothetical protein R2780_00910 [Crocinitomicaceae bacterium]